MKRTVLILCTLPVLGSCGADAVEFGPEREVSKDARNIVWGAKLRDRLDIRPMGPASAGQQPSRRITARTPPGWVERPATSQFRDAVWQVSGEPDTDCYLTIGVGGGVPGNLARWYRNQFGMQEVPAAGSLLQIPFAGRQGRLCELEGTFNGKPDQAGLIAFFADGPQVTSLKFTGPKDVVASNRDAFLALAQSIRLDGSTEGGGQPVTGAAGDGSSGAAGPIEPGATMPPNHPPTGPDAIAVESPFVVDAPDGWQPVAGSHRVLHHKIGEAEVYVSQMGGKLNQLLGVWRGEMGQGPIAEAEVAALPKVQFLGDDAVMMDLTGTYRGMTNEIAEARLIVVARRDNAAVTYCKFVGPTDEVSAQRDAFLAFCASIRRNQ